ncbi:hypothetical protein OAO87_00435 [bacterium]|nr:hypothetical protein [bacterium]
MAPAQTAPRGEPAAARAGPTAGAPSVANATRLHDPRCSVVLSRHSRARPPSGTLS